jgi:ketosteroid isomerase-like protein
MSGENVDRLGEATEALNRGDARAYIGLTDPEIRFEPALAALQGTYEGHDGVREWFADVAEHFDEGVEVRYSEIRDLGDRVLAIGTIRYTGKGSGIRTETPVALIVRFRNGLITHLKDYGDRGEALTAAGLSE